MLLSMSMRRVSALSRRAADKPIATAARAAALRSWRRSFAAAASSTPPKASSAEPEQALTRSPEAGEYPGGVQVPYVDTLEEAMKLPEDADVWPAMRVMDEEGEIVPGAKELDLEALCGGKDEIVGWYRTMMKMNAMDQIFYDAQRQGRISFYMTNTGEEATHIGSASAFKARDMVYGQYREGEFA